MADLQDADGNTFLHLLAAQTGYCMYSESYEELKPRLNSNLTNKAGKTALEIAHSCSNRPMIKLLDPAWKDPFETVVSDDVKKEKERAFKTLELANTASETEIKKKYHSLALLYHPDKPETADVEKFKNVKLAFELLSGTAKVVREMKLLKNRKIAFFDSVFL